METNSNEGTISLSLKAIRLQLATLMDDAGGAQAVKLLDTLSSINPTFRESIINSFLKTLEGVKAEGDLSQIPSDFEEELFQGILNDIEALKSKEADIDSDCPSTSPANREAAEIISLTEYRNRSRRKA